MVDNGPTLVSTIVGSVRGDLGWNCAHLTTIMKICTLIVLDLLNSNLPGAKADSLRGTPYLTIQNGRHL